MSVTFELSIIDCYALREYFLEHEADIANYIDDYGRLNGVFIEIIGREPNQDAVKY